MEDYLIYIWLGMTFVLGTIVGSGLNVAIYRLPLEKSILWPSSRCGVCYQPVRWYDNLPLLSYWVLRGRCRACGTPYSMRYFLIELFTGLVFAGLFYLDIVVNVSDLLSLRQMHTSIQLGAIPLSAWGYWAGHCVLVSFLIITSFCDLDHREIPLNITVTGTIAGVIWSVLFPWPWPNERFDWEWVERRNTEVQQRLHKGIPPSVAAREAAQREGRDPFQPQLLIGAQPWPVWYPLPAWAPAGSWRLGLLTSLAGIAAGTLTLRGVRFLFGLGRGKEGLGLGDADLMMMAGSFLGWQATLLAFFVSVFPALAVGLVQILFRGRQDLAFGPPLALGILTTVLGWRWLGPHFQILFFNEGMLLFLGVFGAVFMFLASFVLRKIRPA